MKAISVQSLIKACRGSLYNGELTGRVSSVSIDTRTITEGAAFVAIRGDNFDGHHFLEQAVASGAKLLVVDHAPSKDLVADVAVVVVDDTLRSLQFLAAWYLKESEVEVVGITGSNGKTSTKDFTKSVLGGKFSVHATAGNYNNHIGLPLTILSMPEGTEVCVLEMGMSGVGEIAELCQIARPRIGVITNVGTAHIEFLGSREAIAEEKGTLARCLPENGVLCLSASCEFADHYRKQTKAKVLIVGNGRGKIRAESLEMAHTGSSFKMVCDTEATKPQINLQVVGRHMVANALLAAGVGYSMGMTFDEIANGLNSAELTSGRLKAFECDGVRVLDDTYNANPESMKAAIEALDELQCSEASTRFAVLGNMAELGGFASESCMAVGKLAANRKIHLISVGCGAKPMADAAMKAGGFARHFEEQESAAHWLETNAQKNDVVLFKGSRSAKMEQVMQKAFPEK